MQPYVGISGVVSPAQQELLGELASAMPGRELLLGVKATHKTQWLDIPNKYGPAWFPVGEDGIAHAVKPGGMLAVAQVYLDEALVSDQTYRDAFTAQLIERSREWITGIQFDLLPWHTASWVGPYLTALRDIGLCVLVQAHSPAMDQLGPAGCAERLAQLAGGIDYVLFDASHGRGVAMNPDALLPFLDAAASRDELAGMGLAVAGGLDAAAVEKQLPRLLGEHPDLSWDAEGRLHQTDDGSIDMTVAGAYLAASARVLGR